MRKETPGGENILTLVPFRFDAESHQYTDLSTGQVAPSITQMLEQTGWIDSTWMTEESRARGTAVHTLCTDYDLDALDLESCHSPYRGYLLAHVKALSIIRPTIEAVEQPLFHPRYRFGGRPDRVVTAWGQRAALEIKSGAKEKAHGVQLGLQALLLAPQLGLPAEAIGRLILYLKPDGKFSLVECKDRRDIDEARRVVARCCHA